MKTPFVKTTWCNGLLALVTACGLLAPTIGTADTIFGLYGSAHLWQPALEGDVGQSGEAFDISGQFSDDATSSTSLMVAVEHPIPLVPNVQLRITPVNWEGASDAASGTLNGAITLNGEVDAEFDLDMVDGTLYYEVLDNWASIDIGLTARQLAGTFSAVERSTGLTDEVEVDQVVPMLYAHARFDLPFTGLAVGARGNGIAISDSNLLDLEAYLHLEVDLLPLIDVGIQGGLRRLSIDVNEGSWNSEASLEGAYVALTAHF